MVMSSIVCVLEYIICTVVSDFNIKTTECAWPVTLITKIIDQMSITGIERCFMSGPTLMIKVKKQRAERMIIKLYTHKRVYYRIICLIGTSANKIHCLNVGLVVGQWRRQWHNNTYEQPNGGLCTRCLVWFEVESNTQAAISSFKWQN